MFQANAFQNNAFQTVAVVVAIFCIHANITIAYPYLARVQLFTATTSIDFKVPSIQAKLSVLKGDSTLTQAGIEVSIC